MVLSARCSSMTGSNFENSISGTNHLTVVSDKKHSLASLAARIRQQCDDLACVLIIKITDRLVSQDQRRVIDQSPGDRDALLLPTAQFRWAMPAAIAQADCLEQLQGAPAVRLPPRNHWQQNVL